MISCFNLAFTQQLHSNLFQRPQLKCPSIYQHHDGPVSGAFASSNLLRRDYSIFTPEEMIGNKILNWIHKSDPKVAQRHTKRHPLMGRPHIKGVVIRTMIKKPKKPNSANRKCVLVRLSDGREKIAHVPKEGHNLQEHSVVLIQFKKRKDVPGLKLGCIRGKYDLPHVIKKTQF